MQANITELEQLAACAQKLSESVANIQINTEQFAGQEVDQEIVNWYKQRFDMFYADNCPGAVVVYLKEMNKRDDINDITRLAISSLALQ